MNSYSNKTLTGGIEPNDQDRTLTGGKWSDECSCSKIRRQDAISLVNQGDVIDGRYKVLDMVGKGGMGVVFRVWHSEWNMEMAMKIPHSHILLDETVRSRFIVEAQTWVELGLHPNIVQCWYVREFDDNLFLFADYISGGNLKEKMRKEEIGPGCLEDIFDLVIQAVDGLGFAHKNGVVHRDIKPANMLITENGRLCVTDFGLAKIMDRDRMKPQKGDTEFSGYSTEESETLTFAGSVLGTPEYGSPEQWADSEHIDFRSDIYSMGVVLFELLCGRRPFDDGIHREPVHVLIGRHLSAAPPDPLKYNTGLSGNLSNLILKCLQKDPGKRPESMPAFREELCGIFFEMFGKPYERPSPEYADLRADSLNNKAVSLWDLKKGKRSNDTFLKALSYDPLHLEALTNLSVIHWQRGKITDQLLLMKMDELSSIHDRRAEYWRIMGEINIARCALDDALYSLQHAKRLDPDNKRTLKLTAYAENLNQRRKRLSKMVWQLPGHKGEVKCVSLDKTGKFGVSGGSDRKINFWSLERGRIISTFGIQSGGMSSVAMFPNGKYALAGSSEYEGNVRFIETWSGKCTKEFSGHQGRVVCADVHKNGELGLTAGQDRVFRVWDLNRMEPAHFFKGMAGPNRIYEGITNSAVISPDTKLILAGCEDCAIRLLYLTSGFCVKTMRGHKKQVTVVAFDRSGKYALSGSKDNSVRLWDIEAGKCLKIYSGHTDTVSAVFLRANIVISSSLDGSIRFWNVETGSCLRTISESNSGIEDLNHSLKGNCAISGNSDGKIGYLHTDFRKSELPLNLSKIRDFKSLNKAKKNVRVLIQTIENHIQNNDAENALILLRKLRKEPGYERDSRSIGLWNKIGRLARIAGINSCWSVRDFKGHGDGTRAVSFNAKGDYAISASSFNAIKTWSVANGNCVHTLTSPKHKIIYSKICDDDRFVYTLSDRLRKWNLETGGLVKEFPVNIKNVELMALSPNERYVLSENPYFYNKTDSLSLWGLSDSEPCHQFEGHSKKVKVIEFSPNSMFALSGSDDKHIRLWNIYHRHCIFILKGHKGPVTSLCFNSNGLMFLSGGEDKTIRLWDICKGKCVRIIRGFSNSIGKILFCKDDRFAVAVDDNHISFLDLVSGNRILRFKAHESKINDISLSPDGQFLLTAGNGRMMKLWEMDWKFEIGEKRDLCSFYHVIGAVPFDKNCEKQSRKPFFKRF